MEEPRQHQAARILVLISGSGTNLQALIDACGTDKLPSAQIVHVISNRKDAYGLIRARDAGISTTYHNLVRYKKQQRNTPEGVQSARGEYDVDLAQIIIGEKPDIVVCAGWMHILSSQFVQRMEEAKIPVINLHPALPGQFNGANAIQRAYAAFQEKTIDHTGIMIHYVISEVDMGEPIVTKEIEMKEGESEEDLEQRIHQSEWGLIVEGTNLAIEKIWNQRSLIID